MSASPLSVRKASSSRVTEREVESSVGHRCQPIATHGGEIKIRLGAVPQSHAPTAWAIWAPAS